jgi:hypothetical protein
VTPESESIGVQLKISKTSHSRPTVTEDSVDDLEGWSQSFIYEGSARYLRSEFWDQLIFVPLGRSTSRSTTQAQISKRDFPSPTHQFIYLPLKFD